jgi:hypothetical protein
MATLKVTDEENMTEEAIQRGKQIALGLLPTEQMKR